MEPEVNDFMYTIRLLVASETNMSDVTSVIPIPDGLINVIPAAVLVYV